jgi:rhamnosyltransferase
VLETSTEVRLGRSPLSADENRLRKTALVVPTYNAAQHWSRLRAALDEQGLEPEQILVIDSDSTDGTDRLAEEAGYRVVWVPKNSFRHGATRQMAAKQIRWAETIVFLTQDAIPYGNHAILNLVAAFADPNIGAAYGRQLPRAEANPIEAHARYFNYPAVSNERSFASREALGFRATFFSNSFAAYRRSALEEVGGFPDVIVSEEVSVVARMLMVGWNLAYQADAEVIHSHPMSLRSEFSRYFDIAVHHSREDWILKEFGHVGGEGTLFLLSELRYLMTHAPHLIPLATLRNGAKWFGYRIGLRERHLPLWTKRMLSAQKAFWREAPSLSLVESRITVESRSTVESRIIVESRSTVEAGQRG